MYITLAFEARIVIHVVNDVTVIFFYSRLLVLKDCLNVPEFRKNLISVSSLCKLNYSFVFFMIDKFLLNLMIFICLRSLIDSFYCVSPLFILPSNESYHNSQEMKEPSTN